MQIRVPTRDCRIAVGRALIEAQGQLTKEHEEFKENSFNALKTGAVHNGLDVTPAREKEMREMVDRDLEHIMESHPLKDRLQVLEMQSKMLLYTKEFDVALDEQDFHVLHKHLPANSAIEADPTKVYDPGGVTRVPA